MANSSTQGPQGPAKFPVLPVILLVLALTCSLGSFVVAALISTDYRILFGALGGIGLFVAIGLGAWLFLRLWQQANRPDRVVEVERKVVDRQVVTHYDEAAAHLEKEITDAHDRSPELSEALQHTLQEHFEKKNGRSGSGDTHTNAEEDESLVEQIGDITWWDRLFDFIVRIAPFVVDIIAALERGRGNSDGSKGGLGCLSRLVLLIPIILIVCCLLTVCVAVLIPVVANIGGGGGPTEPELAPVNTPIPGMPTTAPQSLAEPSPMPYTTPTLSFVPTQGASVGQISNWPQTCADANSTWCFNGYESEGHLFPMLERELPLHCFKPGDVAVTVDEVKSWENTHWNAESGFYYPLRDWYRQNQNYNSQIDLTSWAPQMCSELGGTLR